VSKAFEPKEMCLSSEARQSSGKVEAPVKGQGVWKTFSTLARSRSGEAGELLVAGLEQPDPVMQLAAARAILQYDRRDGIPHLIDAFDKLSPQVCDGLLRHIDDFIHPLRETLAQGPAQARRNVVAIVRRANRLKLAYLLVQALSDPEAEVRDPALEGLKKLAQTYHKQVEQARRGEIELSRTELETRKFALLDPIMSLLSNLSRPQPAGLALLAMGLDIRTNELLFAILNSAQDPRAGRIEQFLWNSISPQIISFLLDCLRNQRVAPKAVAVIQKRRDLPFVRGLLLNQRFFADYRVRDQLGQTAGAKAPGKKRVVIEVPELELPWAHPEAESLPEDAFTQFFNTFDQLDEATKLLAVQTLKRLDPDHLEHIQQELASLEGANRLKAVRIVVMFHREQDVEEALLSLAQDSDRHVRATVVKTLGILEDEMAIRTLLDAVTDADRRVVANSVEAIETVGRDELLGLVRIFVTHPNNRIRANAIKALWTLGDNEAGKLLGGMLDSDDDMMRLSATWLLGEVDHSGRIELLMKIAKNDPSDLVRRKALSILGETD